MKCYTVMEKIRPNGHLARVDGKRAGRLRKEEWESEMNYFREQPAGGAILSLWQRSTMCLILSGVEGWEENI